MTTTAQSVIRRAAETLQDLTAVRWSTAELVRYLNDGQREILMYRPDALSTTVTLTLVAGARQTLPSTAAKLIDVVRNSADTSTKRSIRIVNRQLLDSQVPDWHIATSSVNIVHYMYDTAEPRVYYVYPPATTLARVDAVVAQYPTAISEPSSGTTYSAVTGDISAPDILANALTDYVIARAFMKDAEQLANASRAQAHYALFTNALGIDAKTTSDIVPNTAGAPAHGVSA